MERYAGNDGSILWHLPLLSFIFIILLEVSDLLTYFKERDMIVK